ncbi:MAG: efflux RND transporter periplasmic adaptor subunit [Myxococcota bacterium]|nr:efflux RND transporter periplasmic adaptor subunit [Myxococcota bacterium]
MRNGRTAWLMTLLFLGCGDGGPDEEDEQESRPDARTLVEVAVVAKDSVGSFLASTGTVQSVAEANLVPETTGTVVSIKAEEGDVVRKGQVLAIIANPNLDANLSRAEAEKAKAELEYARVKELSDQGAISEREYRETEHLLQTATTSLTEAQRTQGFTRVVSPIDGTVAVRDLRYGEVAGGQRAFQVVDLQQLRVVVQLPERDLPSLKEGQVASFTSVYEDGGSATGRVARISPIVDAQTGTVRVTLSLDLEGNELRPGQFVSVRIEVDIHEDVVTIERRALRYQEGEPIAYRVVIEEEKEEEDQKKARPSKKKASRWGGGGDGGDFEEPDYPGPRRIAHVVELELGYVDEDLVEVKSGLEIGDEVVVLGNTGLRDGSRVRFSEDPTLADSQPDEEE